MQLYNINVHNYYVCICYSTTICAEAKAKPIRVQSRVCCTLIKLIKNKFLNESMYIKLKKHRNKIGMVP